MHEFPTDNQESGGRSVEALAVREAYLAQMSRELVERLSPLEHYESIEEMRVHLNSMAAAYEEVGMEPVSAMAAAVSRFGSATHVGKEISNSMGTPRKVTTPVRTFGTVALTASLGAIVMLLIDVIFSSIHASTVIPEVDIKVGGLTGILVAIASLVVRLKPKAFVLSVTLLSQFLLLVTVFRTEPIMRQLDRYLWVAIPTSLGVAILCAFSLSVARYLSNVEVTYRDVDGPKVAQ